MLPLTRPTKPLEACALGLNPAYNIPAQSKEILELSQRKDNYAVYSSLWEKTMLAVDVRCLLDEAVAFETRLEQFFAELRDKSKDNNLRLLAYYLSRRRRRISDIVTDSEGACLDQLSGMQIKLKEPFSPLGTFSEALVPVEDIEGEKLIQASRKYALELIRIYNIILSSIDFPALREALLELKKAERRDLSMLEKLQSINYF